MNTDKKKAERIIPYAFIHEIRGSNLVLNSSETPLHLGG
jgi:hypothetical protein